MFLSQLTLLRKIFQKNDFINRCLKLVLNRIHILKEKVLTVKNRPPELVLSYLATISLQTRTKLQKSIKGILNCCKLHAIFKSQNKLSNKFNFKDPIPQILA